MEHHFHVGDLTGELKSDALIVAIVVAVVVGYVAARGRSASPAAKKNKPVPFRKILQGNITQSDNIGKVLSQAFLLSYLPNYRYYLHSCQVRFLHADFVLECIQL